MTVSEIFSEAFSQRLTTLRNGRKKADFADFLGLKPPTYFRYEAGRLPRMETLKQIADRCGVTVDWLLGREPLAGLPAAKPGSSDMAVERQASPGRSAASPTASALTAIPVATLKKIVAVCHEMGDYASVSVFSAEVARRGENGETESDVDRLTANGQGNTLNT